MRDVVATTSYPLLWCLFLCTCLFGKVGRCRGVPCGSTGVFYDYLPCDGLVVTLERPVDVGVTVILY